MRGSVSAQLEADRRAAQVAAGCRCEVFQTCQFCRTAPAPAGIRGAAALTPAPAQRVVRESQVGKLKSIDHPSALAIALRQNIETGRILDWMTKEPGRFVKIAKGPFKGRLYFIDDAGCPVRVKPAMLIRTELVLDGEDHG